MDKRTLKSDLRHLLSRAANPPPRIGRMGRRSLWERPRRMAGRRCIEIGDRTLIKDRCYLWAIQEDGQDVYHPRIRIGDDVFINAEAWLVCADGITIEDGCVLSRQVFITDVEHGYDPQAGPIIRQKLARKGRVHIQAGTFIGVRAAIMPGVTLGRHCVVAANSVVTHSFPDYSMVAGMPARLIKTYSLDEGRWVPAASTRDLQTVG